MRRTTTIAPPSSAPSDSVPAPANGRRNRDRRRLRETLLAYLFLTPTLTGLLVFTAGPILIAVGLSFFDWNILTEPRFIGLDNYKSIAADQTVIVSFRNTIVFVLLAVTLQLVISLLLALALEGKLPKGLTSVFRSAFFFPIVTSAASVSIIMSYLFNDRFGAVNYYLGMLGLDVPWLTSSTWAMGAIVISYVWQQFGLTFLLFVGGLAGIPREIHEAATMDGAVGFRRFFNVTLPLLSPTVLLATVISLIHALQVFDQPFVMTRGGPGDATNTVVMVIYRDAFENLQFGRASAVSVLLIAVIGAVTAAQFRLSRKFVFYQ